MTDTVKWIKIAINIFDNRKIKQIEAMPDGDSLLVIWMKLLCLAGNVNDDGLIYLTSEIPYTEEMLANEFNRPLQTIRLALNTFQAFGMVDVIDNIYHVSSWERYQNAEALSAIKENRRARNARYYERRKQRRLAEQQMSNELLPVNTDSKEDNNIDTDMNTDISTENTEKKNKDILDTKIKEYRRKDVSHDVLQDVLKDGAPSEFDVFWDAYPRKKNKEYARKAFAKAIKDTDIETILDALSKQKQSHDWQKANGQYIPYPASWLNAHKWEDEDAITGVDTFAGSNNPMARYNEVDTWQEMK